jgi:hypothetical protein
VQGNKVARRHVAMDACLPVLAEHARANGGRFLLFRSAARGRMTCDSNVDTILDGRQDRLNEAWISRQRRSSIISHAA